MSYSIFMGFLASLGMTRFIYELQVIIMTFLQKLTIASMAENRRASAARIFSAKEKTAYSAVFSN